MQSREPVGHSSAAPRPVHSADGELLLVLSSSQYHWNGNNAKRQRKTERRNSGRTKQDADDMMLIDRTEPSIVANTIDCKSVQLAVQVGALED
jgi:hypothetical protein